jgi:hypothetical protein
MTTETTATVVDGALKLDEPLDLPNETRVRVKLEYADNRRQARQEALKRLFERLKQHPINSGGMHFTRDEIYDRV